jgi:CHAT domain-containing protein
MGMVNSADTHAQEEGSAKTQEYFIQQAEDEDILIIINGFEAEFKSKITTDTDKTLLWSEIAGSRMAPVFQYINATGKNRQLDIEVSSELYTGRSEFGLELTRLKVWDQRSSAVAQAYQLLSFGMQVSGDTNKANWSVRADSLVNAGRLFQQFGMKEMRLWSNFLAAHLIHYKLNDYSIVFSMTREILADLEGTRFKNIELAALQLQSAALIRLNRPSSESSPVTQVQRLLSRIAGLAESMGFYYEQAQALNASGIEYVASSLYSQALEQFQLAVDIADSVGDAELATGIRESIVQIHAIQGNTPATGEVLKEIETQLTEDGGGDELALNLLAQGRLLITNYRYDEAVGLLLQALEHENNSGLRMQIHFELARIFYETGRLNESLTYLELARISPDPEQQRRGSSVITTGEGLRIMANIYRARGETRAMREARRAQALYRPAASRFFYDQGLDMLASGSGNRQQADELFRKSHAAAVKSGSAGLQHLTRLQICAIENTTAGSNLFCSSSNIRASYEWLTASAIPRSSLHAMMLWSQILINRGNRSEALSVLDKLMDEIHLFRHSLPGVLGAWYREYHELVFESYLNLQISVSDRDSSGNHNASLLALSKIRQIDRYTGYDAALNTGSEDADLLRIQLARLANPEPGLDLIALRSEVNQGITALRRPFSKKFEYLSRQGLQKHLASLSGRESVLTYHLTPESAYAWVAQKNRVRIHRIENPGRVYSSLLETRQGLENAGIKVFDDRMDRLGRLLLEPLTGSLSETIYWIPSGPLLGLPLDAIRYKGRYLIEQHQLVNLLSFPSNIGPSDGLKAGNLESVFLAGHPQDYSGGYAMRLETSSEIRTVADIFVGPGLRIIQGNALLPDEFQDGSFSNVDLAHLAMPGIIDLGHPEQSSLELSEHEYLPGRTLYRPVDILSQEMSAKLVFLSNTGFANQPQSGFSSHPGLVTDFLDAGAGAVISNLWESDGPAAELLIGDFYKRLQTNGDILSSLNDARLKYLENNRDNGLYDWAGFQLYID